MDKNIKFCACNDFQSLDRFDNAKIRRDKDKVYCNFCGKKYEFREPRILIQILKETEFGNFMEESSISIGKLSELLKGV